MKIKINPYHTVCVVFFLLLGHAMIVAKPVSVKHAWKLEIDSLNLHWQDSLRSYKQNQDYLRMLDLFKKLKQELPANPQVWSESGQFQLQIGQIDQAQVDFGEAARLEPDNKDHWRVLVDIAIFKKDYERLLTLSDEMMKREPEEPKNYSQKAFAYFQMGKSEEALQTLDFMRERLGNIPAYYMDKARILQELKRTKESYLVLKDWQANGEVSPELYLMFAESHMQDKKTKEAIRILNDGIQLYPNHGPFYLVLADLYIDQKEYKSIIPALDKAFADTSLSVQIKMASLYRFFGPEAIPVPKDELKHILQRIEAQYPQHFEVTYLLGDAYLTMRDYAQAEAYYLQALSINNQMPEVWGQLIQVYLQQQQLDKVLEIGLEAKKLFPNQSRLLYFIANAYMGKSDFLHARSYLEEGLNAADKENKVELVAFYGDLGYVYYKLGMYAESFVAFDEALQLEPDQSLLLNNYAYYLSLQKKDLDKAYTMALRSQSLDGESPHVYDTIAWILFQQDKWKEAQKWIKKAIKLTQPASSTVHEHYGDILMKLGKTKKAIAQWNQALQLKPTEEQKALLNKKINEKAYLEN
jgi:tetratricopeptide (TPR) repeat protein